MKEIIIVSILLVLKIGLEEKYNIKIGYIKGAVVVSLIILSITAVTHYFLA